MSGPTVFVFDSHALRVATAEDGQPWFVAADVAAALEFHTASDMVRTLDDDEKGKQAVRTPGGNQEMLLISEAGLYAAIFRSRKEKATPFKRWVTHEVLPAIRKTGKYGAGPSASQHLAAHALRLRLLERLGRERRPAMRQAVYDQLRQLSHLMGLATPSLESMGACGSKDPDGLSRLWTVLDHLSAKGVAYNHARDPNLLAINIPQVQKLCAEHHLGPPLIKDMRRSLAAAPQYIDNRTVNSKLTGRSVKCWLFSADRLPHEFASATPPAA